MPKNRAARAAALLLATPAAWAHEGHGLFGTHWHATDAFGLLVVGGLAALVAWWLSGGGR
jgi:hypothetical protein